MALEARCSLGPLWATQHNKFSFVSPLCCRGSFGVLSCPLLHVNGIGTDSVTATAQLAWCSGLMRPEALNYYHNKHIFLSFPLQGTCSAHPGSQSLSEPGLFRLWLVVIATLPNGSGVTNTGDDGVSFTVGMWLIRTVIRLVEETGDCGK